MDVCLYVFFDDAQVNSNHQTSYYTLDIRSRGASPRYVHAYVRPALSAFQCECVHQDHMRYDTKVLDDIPE